MNRLDPEQVMDLLAQALELAGEQQREFLDSTCAASPELRRELEALLNCAAPAAEMFDTVLTREVRADPGVIGPYELLEPVGEGGMAVVYKAQQHHPIKRLVALKLIKLGMDTRQFVARFESERQALALMDHPSVARVFDAGSTETGRPYFVMEYVPGERIVKWCDRRKLTVRQRLELFIGVCEAVEHAHRKGIIHRDLKNSNVLVTDVDGRSLPKVIDFGVAKAVDQRLTDLTMHTEQGQLIGTPEYMSPEQAELGSLAVDTRSDVYSLGVLLYELLAGVQPFASEAMRTGTYAQVQKLIREKDAPRLTTRLGALGPNDLSEVAQRRGVTARAFALQLRHELEWIPLKAMRKDREQRYRSAAELADDIRNYLDGRPLIAGPESARYRLGKFVRRNRVATVSGALIALSLLVGTAVSIAFGVSERRQRRAAETARHELEQVAAFQEGQFGAIDPAAMGIRLRSDLLEKARAAAERSQLPAAEIEARALELERLIAGGDFTGMALESLQTGYFEPALKQIEANFADQPLIQARLFQTMASTLQQLGLLEAATEPQHKALGIRRRVLGASHKDTLSSAYGMGNLLREQGKLADAEPYLRSALEGFQNLLGGDDPETLTAMSVTALLLESQGRLTESEQLLRTALDKQRQVLGDDHPETLHSLNNLGVQLKNAGKLAEAERCHREVLERSANALGPEDPKTALYTMTLGALLREQGKLEEAETFLRRALLINRRSLGDAHPVTLGNLGNLGLVLRSRGKFEDAEACYREVLATRLRILGSEHPSTLTVMHNLAVLLLTLGRLDEAETCYRTILEQRRRLLDADHPDLLVSINHMGRLLIAQNKPVEAEPYCLEALERYRRVLGPEHPDTLISARVMAALLLMQGRHADAAALLAPAEQAYRRAFSARSPANMGVFLAVLGRSQIGLREYDAAEANLKEAIEVLTNADGVGLQDRIDAACGMVELYEARAASEPHAGHQAAAEHWRERLKTLRGTTQPATRPAQGP